MKKLFLFLLFPLVLSGQGKFTSTWVGDGTNDYFYLAGTNADTSTYYIMSPYLTFKLFLADTTSGGDSSSVRFYVDRCFDPVIQQDWIVEDSLDISSDSTWTSWIYTSESRSNETYYRVRSKGLIGNRILASVKALIRQISWQYR